MATQFDVSPIVDSLQGFATTAQRSVEQDRQKKYDDRRLELATNEDTRASMAQRLRLDEPGRKEQLLKQAALHQAVPLFATELATGLQSVSDATDPNAGSLGVAWMRMRDVKAMVGDAGAEGDPLGEDRKTIVGMLSKDESGKQLLNHVNTTNMSLAKLAVPTYVKDAETGAIIPSADKMLFPEFVQKMRGDPIQAEGFILNQVPAGYREQFVASVLNARGSTATSPVQIGDKTYNMNMNPGYFWDASSGSLKHGIDAAVANSSMTSRIAYELEDAELRMRMTDAEAAMWDSSGGTEDMMAEESFVTATKGMSEPDLLKFTAKERQRQINANVELTLQIKREADGWGNMQNRLISKNYHVTDGKGLDPQQIEEVKFMEQHRKKLNMMTPEMGDIWFEDALMNAGYQSTDGLFGTSSASDSKTRRKELATKILSSAGYSPMQMTAAMIAVDQPEKAGDVEYIVNTWANEADAGPERDARMKVRDAYLSMLEGDSSHKASVEVARVYPEALTVLNQFTKMIAGPTQEGQLEGVVTDEWTSTMLAQRGFPKEFTNGTQVLAARDLLERRIKEKQFRDRNGFAGQFWKKDVLQQLGSTAHLALDGATGGAAVGFLSTLGSSYFGVRALVSQTKNITTGMRTAGALWKASLNVKNWSVRKGMQTTAADLAARSSTVPLVTSIPARAAALKAIDTVGQATGVLGAYALLYDKDPITGLASHRMFSNGEAELRNSGNGIAIDWSKEMADATTDIYNAQLVDAQTEGIPEERSRSTRMYERHKKLFAGIGMAEGPFSSNPTRTDAVEMASWRKIVEDYDTTHPGAPGPLEFLNPSPESQRQAAEARAMILKITQPGSAAQLGGFQSFAGPSGASPVAASTGGVSPSSTTPGNVQWRAKSGKLTEGTPADYEKARAKGNVE